MEQVIWLQKRQFPIWDAFVKKHPFGWISHLSAWKTVLERSFKHIEGHLAAIWEDSSNQIIAGIPIYTVKSLLTGNRLVSAPFVTHGEALISDPQHMETLLSPILELYHKTKASYVELNTWRSASLIQTPCLRASHFYRHHYIDIDRTPEELKKTFHKSCIQSKISKALNKNLRLKVGESETDLAVFYRMFSQTRKRVGLPPFPYRFFKTMWQFLGSTKHLDLLIVYYKGQPVASSILFKFGKMVVSEYNCDTGEFRSLGVNQFCVWEAIKLAYDEGFKIFSLGRTSLSNKGLMVYKGRWGTKQDELPRFFFPGSFCNKAEKSEADWRYKLISLISRKIPQPFFNSLGEAIYRHLG